MSVGKNRVLWLGLALLLLASLTGCGSSSVRDDGSDSDTSAHSDVDGDSTPGLDGDTEAESAGEEADSEASESPDGDGSEGDATEDAESEKPTSGSIRGTVHVSSDYVAYPRRVDAYTENPFADSTAQPVATATLPANSPADAAYSITGLATAHYYLVLTVDVGADNDAKNDRSAVYPTAVLLVVGDLTDLTGIDLYLGVQNPAWGSITGTLHLGEAYRSHPITLVAYERHEDGTVEAWPAATDHLDAADSETRTFSLRNLVSGDYYVTALVGMGDGEGALVYTSPYGPYPLKTDAAAKSIFRKALAPAKNFTSQVFYIGMVDPAWGSVTGTITLPTAISGGQMSVWVIAAIDDSDSSDDSDIPAKDDTPKISLQTTYKPETIILLQKGDNDTQVHYEVGNLVDGRQLYVAGVYKIDDTHTSLATLPGGGQTPTKLTIDFASDSTKHYTGENITLPVTEVTGTLSIDHSDFTNPAYAQIALVDSLSSASKVGGSAAVDFRSTKAVSKSYRMFPVSAGTWYPIVRIYQVATPASGDTPATYTSKICTPGLIGAPSVSITATQRSASFNISVTAGVLGTGWTCRAPSKGEATLF